jgi:TonB family protein
MAKVDYPKLYQALHWEGVTKIGFVVDRQGNVAGVHIVQSSGSRFLELARSA